jgi:hypothetical protein
VECGVVALSPLSTLFSQLHTRKRCVKLVRQGLTNYSVECGELRVEFRVFVVEDSIFLSSSQSVFID